MIVQLKNYAVFKFIPVKLRMLRKFQTEIISPSVAIMNGMRYERKLSVISNGSGAKA
jgi:hypothetical protein